MQFNALTEQYLDDLKNQDYRTALICTLLAEINRDPKKRPQPFDIEDFMPQRGRTRIMTDDEMKTKLELINLALGGKHDE